MMRLLLKHVRRTVVRAPLQPLLILLTVTLSVAVAVTAFCMIDLFSEHNERVMKENVELGDVVISLRGDAEVRMLFSEDAKALVGDSAEVLGEYSLTAFFETDRMHVLSASAVDLVAASRYFELVFLEYGHFTTENMEYSVILSASAAEEHGLRLGDTLELRVLGKELSYTVQAIASDKGILRECDVLIPASGVMRILSQHSPLFSTVGESLPSNRLMLRVNDGAQIETVFDTVSKSEAFSSARVIRTVNATQRSYLMRLQLVSVAALAMLLLVMSAILIGTSLSLLREQRSMELALFCGAGASRAQLAGLQMLESLLYALVGGAFGCCLAVPMFAFTGGLFSWQTESTQIGPVGVLFGVLFSFLLMTVCTARHLMRQKTLTLAEWLARDQSVDTRKPQSKRTFYLSLILTAALTAVTLLLSPAHRMWTGALSILSTIWLLYTLTPSLLNTCARITDRVLQKGRRPHAGLLLAVKNLRSHEALQQVARLLAVLLSLLTVVTFCSSVVGDQVENIGGMLEGELIAANLSEEAFQALSSDDRIDGSLRFNFISNAEFSSGDTAMVILLDGDTRTCLNPAIVPKQLPQGDGAVLSKGLALLLGVSEGDELEIVLQGVPYRVTVLDVYQTSSNLIYLDIDLVRSSRVLVNLKLSEAALSDETIRRELIGQLELQGVVLLETYDIFTTLPATLQGFLDLLRWTVAATVVLAMLGCANVLSEQYRARRHERELLRLCGMERGLLVEMCAYELVILLTVAILAAAVFALLLCFLLNCCVGSFGLALF